MTEEEIIPDDDLGTVDLEICDQKFHVTMVPDTPDALDMFNKAKEVFTKYGYLNGDEEYPPENSEMFGREISGLIMSAYNHTVSEIFLPVEEAGDMSGEVSSGHGYEDKPEVMNELKAIIIDSKLINDSFLYFSTDLIDSIGFSKGCIGIDFRNELDED